MTLCPVTVAWSQFQPKSSRSQWGLTPLAGFLATLVNKRPVLLLSTLDGTNKGGLKCWGQTVYVTIILQPKNVSVFWPIHQFMCPPFTEWLMKSCIWCAPIRPVHFKGISYRETFLRAVTSKYDSINCKPQWLWEALLYTTHQPRQIKLTPPLGWMD